LDIVALAADVVAADARLNIWACELQNKKYEPGKADLERWHAHFERWMEIVDFFAKAEDQAFPP